MRTGIDLLALYKTLGLSQGSVCKLVGIKDVESLRRQVKDKARIYEKTWQILDKLAEKRDREIDRLVEANKDKTHVTFPLWDGNHWEGEYRNSIVLTAAWILEGDGITVSYQWGEPIIRDDRSL